MNNVDKSGFVVIQPSSSVDAVVACSLETFSLDDEFDHLALSHVWGDANVTEDILVNGLVLPVTVNLVAALRQLRKTRAEDESSALQELPLLVWADAIFINQNDITERSSQVQLMRSIYGRARKVVSWLEPEADDGARTIATTRAIALEVTNLGPDDDRLDWLRQYPELTTEIVIGGLWEAVGHLWNRDYWKRTWILQETVLAREVLILYSAQISP